MFPPCTNNTCPGMHVLRSRHNTQAINQVHTVKRTNCCIRSCQQDGFWSRCQDWEYKSAAAPNLGISRLSLWSKSRFRLKPGCKTNEELLWRSVTQLVAMIVPLTLPHESTDQTCWGNAGISWWAWWMRSVEAAIRCAPLYYQGQSKAAAGWNKGPRWTCVWQTNLVLNLIWASINRDKC